jgi:hypothetical protein
MFSARLNPANRNDFNTRAVCDDPEAMARRIAPARGLGVPALSAVSKRRKAAKSRIAANPTASSGAGLPPAPG